MAFTDLDTIRIKTRRLTRSPSTQNLSDADLDQYINTAVLFDLPSELRLFNLRQTLTFYTQPNIDTYSTNTTNPMDPLYNFKNKYISIHPPIFMAGIQSFFTQQRDVFYGYYPQTNIIYDSQLRGNNTTGPFSGTITNAPMLQNNVIITCLDNNSNSMILVDYPIPGSPATGYLSLPNDPQATLPSPYGTINYLTGTFTAIFPAATQDLATIWVENIGYQPGKPIAMLYYSDTFTIRPVPDKTYAIQIEVDVQPTELLADNQSPDLQQWWQYIAYLAARLIFQDRMDIESVNNIMPELKRQERLCLRTTLTQQANERTVTIYTQGKNYGFGWFGAGGWPY